jgi:hypothetical protein
MAREIAFMVARSDEARFQEKVERQQAAAEAMKDKPDLPDQASERAKAVREARLAKAGMNDEGEPTETADEARQAEAERTKRRIERDLKRSRGEEVPDEDGEIEAMDATERLHAPEPPPPETRQQQEQQSKAQPATTQEQPKAGFDRDQPKRA